MNPDELQRLLAALRAASRLDPDSPEYRAVERAVGRLAKTGKKRRRLARQRATAEADRQALRVLAAARVDRDNATEAEPVAELRRTRHCYACGGRFRQLQRVYPWHCPPCAALALAKRQQRADLSGRRALVTGGRIKIGHAVAHRLLQDGAEVHITTRFPREAESRFAALADVSVWGERLHVHGLDFRSLPDVLERIDAWSAGPAFDILVNNAAQTVWRPPDYYRALWRGEQQTVPTRFVRSIAPTVRRAAMSGVLGLPRADTDIVVAGAAEPLDLRRVNSWVQTLVDIDPAEMIEVQVVNAIVPFLLVARLAANLQRSRFATRCIVNVTAVEGRFDRAAKSPRHPHTNMAKAGLNMLTLTAAGDLAARGIHMVAVDPGWMSHEGPVDLVERARRAGVEPPLDAVDAAARVYDPIVQGLAGQPLSGCLLKNFVAVDW